VLVASTIVLMGVACDDDDGAETSGTTVETSGTGGDGGGTTVETSGSGGIGGVTSAGGTGGTGGVGTGAGGSAMMASGFDLANTNPNSVPSDQNITLAQFSGQVSAWFFGHST